MDMFIAISTYFLFLEQSYLNLSHSETLSDMEPNHYRFFLTYKQR